MSSPSSRKVRIKRKEGRKKKEKNCKGYCYLDNAPVEAQMRFCTVNQCLDRAQYAKSLNARRSRRESPGNLRNNVSTRLPSSYEKTFVLHAVLIHGLRPSLELVFTVLK